MPSSGVGQKVQAAATARMARVPITASPTPDSPTAAPTSAPVFAPDGGGAGWAPEVRESSTIGGGSEGGGTEARSTVSFWEERSTVSLSAARSRVGWLPERSTVSRPASPDGRGAGGKLVGPAGDLNGDGELELWSYVVGGGAPGTFVYFGPHSGTRTHDDADVALIEATRTHQRLGALTPMGDLDADGCDDFLLGDHEANGEDGRALIFFGSAP